MSKNDNIYKSLTIALILSFIFLVWWCFDLYNMDDKELYSFVYKDRSKGAGNLLILVYKYFGNIGLIIEPWPLFGFLLFCWFGEYQTYKKRKATEIDRHEKEQKKIEQFSKRKSWKKKQEQKRKKQEQKQNKRW